MTMRTHGSREDNDAQNIHLLAVAGARLVQDLRRRGQLQVDCPPVGIVVIGNYVHKVGLDVLRGHFEDGHQVRFVLQNKTVTLLVCPTALLV